MKRNRDLTVGSPMRVLPLFALPMLVSVIFQQLYNIADNIIAGKFLGDDALAAVSVSYPVTMIYMAVAIGINVGGSVVISQLFGSGEYSRMKSAVSTAILSCVVIALLMTGAGFIFMRPILHLLHTPDNIIGETWQYMMIYTAGLTFIFLYNICNGIFTAIGDSVTPLILLIVSSLGNVVLDILFVAQLHMSVAGCAWATFVCQTGAAVSAYLVLRRRLHSMEGKRKWLFSMTMFRMIARLSIPSVLQQSFVSVGNLFIQSLVNSYEMSYIIGGYGAAIKLNTFTVTIMTTLSGAISSYTAQNIGAGKVERVPEGWKAAYLLSLVIIIPATVLYFFFGDIPMRLFATDSSADVLAVGQGFLRIVAPFYAVITIKVICDGVLRGAGVVKEFTISTFADLLLRVALAYMLSRWFGYRGIWMAWPFGWIMATVISFGFYKRGHWKTENILKK